MVVSGKEVSSGDLERLDGQVQRILQKGTFTKERLLADVNQLVTQFSDRPDAAADESSKA